MARFHTFGDGGSFCNVNAKYILCDEKDSELDLFVKARDAAFAAQCEADNELRAILEKTNLNNSQVLVNDVLPHHPSKQCSGFSFQTVKEVFNEKIWGIKLRGYGVWAMLVVFLYGFCQLAYELVMCLLSSEGLPNEMCVLMVCNAILCFLIGTCEWAQKNHTNAILLLLSMFWIWGNLKLTFVTYLNQIFASWMVTSIIFTNELHRLSFRKQVFSRLLGFHMHIRATLLLWIPEKAYYPSLPSTGWNIICSLCTKTRHWTINLVSCIPWKDINGYYQGRTLGFTDIAQLSSLRNMIFYFLKFKPFRGLHYKDPLSPKPVNFRLRRRALGGFAGGFAGVSSLRSINPTAFPEVPSNNLFASCDIRVPLVTNLVSTSSSSFLQDMDSTKSTSIGSC